MIQCVSDSNPYDDEPDPIEEAERWLSCHPDDITKSPEESESQWARSVIEMLLAYIEDEI